MNRREFLKQAGLSAFSLMFAKGIAFGRKEPPNFVLLFADDLGYGDLGCYGHPIIRTPNLDRLARQGIRLTSFYAAAPTCSPSRASLLTGRYGIRCGLPYTIGPESTRALSRDVPTLAEVLKEAGYATAAIGKWHLGHSKPEYLPLGRGFDYYFGLLYSNDMTPPWVKTRRPLKLYRNNEPVEYPVKVDLLTQRYTEEAVNFIRKNRNRPFFLYLPYSMPHLPLGASERFRGRSRAGLYGDVVEELDWSVGRILEELRSLGLEENTFVVFTSDNGPWLHLPPRMLQGGVKPWHVGSPGPLRGAKATTYEGGLRVPCIIRWPAGLPSGKVLPDLFSTLDIFPTFVAAAGLKVKGDLDGENILPYLRGEPLRREREFYYFMNQYLEAVRVGPWKYRFGIDRISRQLREELFHLELDPSERYNMLEQERKLAERLREQLLRFAQQTGALVRKASTAQKQR